MLFFFFPFALCLQVKSALNGASQLYRQGSVYDCPALFLEVWKVRQSFAPCTLLTKFPPASHGVLDIKRILLLALKMPRRLPSLRVSHSGAIISKYSHNPHMVLI